MFAFGKGLKQAKNDIIGYDILFTQERYIKPLQKYAKVFVNLNGDIITPSCRYYQSIHKIRQNRKKVDRGLYTYKYGFKLFASKPKGIKDAVIVPIIIPRGAYFSYNLFGQMLSSEVIYPNRF